MVSSASYIPAFFLPRRTKVGQWPFVLAGYALFLFCLVGVAASQVDPAAGILPFSTQQFGVDLATGALHVSIPIRTKIGKIPFSYSLEGNFDIFRWALSTGGTEWWGNASLTGQPVQTVYWGAGKTTCGHSGGESYDLYVTDDTGAQHPCGGHPSL